MSRLTIGRFATLAHARNAGELSKAIGDLPFTPSTDSRTVQAGETFVCLRGPNYDGHAFAHDAARRGAVAVVGDENGALPSDLTIPVLRVADARRAYISGAAAVRAGTRCTVVGVTGSVGKTTVKAMCAQLLERHRRTLVTPQNENNELGVSKACYAMADDVQAAVIEMGARAPGEIAELVDIAAPEVGILTNVGESHLEFFEDRGALARTKFALFSKGARPILSAADEWSRMLAAEAGIARGAVWVRLCGDPAVEGLALEAGEPRGGKVPLTFGASHANVDWNLIGEHHLRDALLAACGAILAGLTFEQAASGFGALALPPGRFELHELPNRAVVIYDAYNASPTSVAHALRAFVEVPATRHIAVLGSMAELGAGARAQHEATGAAAARSGVDILYCGGAFADALADGARGGGMEPSRVSLFADNESVASELLSRLGEGDAVLLKGSRVQKMEQILAALLDGETVS